MSRIFSWLESNIQLRDNEEIILISFDRSLFPEKEAINICRKAGYSTKNRLDNYECWVFLQRNENYTRFRDLQIIHGLTVRFGELV